MNIPTFEGLRSVDILDYSLLFLHGLLTLDHLFFSYNFSMALILLRIQIYFRPFMVAHQLNLLLTSDQTTSLLILSFYLRLLQYLRWSNRQPQLFIYFSP